MLRMVVLSLFGAACGFSVAATEMNRNCEMDLIPMRSNLSLGAIRYDRLTTEGFRFALSRELATAKANLHALESATRKPDFKNTIEALEYVATGFDQIGQLLHHFFNVKRSPENAELYAQLMKDNTALVNATLFNPKIFARVKAVYDTRSRRRLNAVQMRLLEVTYKSFVKNGALLDSAGQARLNAIDEKLGQLRIDFDNNALADERSLIYFETDPAQIEGLPADAAQAAAQLATEHGRPGTWAFQTLESQIVPVWRFADHSELREKLWRLYWNSNITGETDNRAIVIQTAKLRQEKAALLGYASFADYQLENRLAHDGKTVEDFHSRLAEAVLPFAKADLAELEAYAGRPMQPWDIEYYAEKVRQHKYGFGEEELRPYFSLENVIRGAFFTANKLYGIRFVPRPDLPAWDPLVRVFEVRDRDDSVIALYYLDAYARHGKRSGAWNTSLQASGMINGKWVPAHVINGANFKAPGADGEPTLLNPRDAETIFHELGHGLQSLLSRAYYPSMAGNAVAWDIVELPSQLNERWMWEKEVLDICARHYQTGERIPEALVAKVQNAKNYFAGYRLLRQVQSGILDMAWHMDGVNTIHVPDDLPAWEKNIFAQYELVERHGTLRSPGFSHVFSGGYGAGYYSYAWSEVIDAHAFEAWRPTAQMDEEGTVQVSIMNDTETSNKFRREILEKGGSIDAAAGYRNFRGEDPDPLASLRAKGLLR